MSFGLILKQARTHKKLTQSRLSELLSVSPQTISGWERNVYFPEQDKLLGLAKILDLSLGILTENSPEKDREEHNIVHKDAKEHHTMHKDTKVIAICGLTRDKSEMMRLHDQWRAEGKNPIILKPFDFFRQEDWLTACRMWASQRKLLEKADLVYIVNKDCSLHPCLWHVACYAFMTDKAMNMSSPVAPEDIEGMALHHMDLAEEGALSQMDWVRHRGFDERSCIYFNHRGKAVADPCVSLETQYDGSIPWVSHEDKDLCVDPFDCYGNSKTADFIELMVNKFCPERDEAYQEKIRQYNQLVYDVDHFDAKALSEINLETFSEHYSDDLRQINLKEINLWSYWQGGRSHLDADILLVGQDFSGLEGDNPLLDYQKDRFDYLKDIAGYSTTDNNLCKLFAELGFPDLRNNRNTYRQLFFTNFVPWYRKNMERNSGGFNPKWIAPSLPFFKRLVEIIEPKIILCLGQEIFIAVLKAGGKSHKRGGYNKVIETGAVEIEIGSVKSAVYPLAHPGSLGTSNRKRGTSEKDGLSLQKADWRKIAEKLADAGRPLGLFRWMPRVIRPTDV